MHVPIERPVSIVTFYNWTTMPFTGVWAKTEYHFAPGEKSKMEDWKAEHFALHLTDQYLHSIGKEARRKEDSYKKVKEQAIIRQEGAQVAKTPGDVAKLTNEIYNDKSLQGPTEEQLRNKELAANAKELGLKAEDIPKVKQFCDYCASKGVRHLKTCPTLKKNEAAQTPAS